VIQTTPSSFIGKQTTSASAAVRGSYYSRSPWCGYTNRERPRAVALPVCPSARCRRAKACIDAIDKLYCRRTHESPPKQPTSRAGKTGKRISDSALLDYANHLKILAEKQQDRHDDMTERWKAGEFDHLYGKYSSKGVLKVPPPKVYVEN
jgi:hypothetical protein